MSAWEEQGFPLLRALENPKDHHLKEGVLWVGDDGAATLGLEISEGELFETLFQLRDLEYVAFGEPEYEGGGSAGFMDLRITGRGLQVLGEWPRFEAMVSPVTLAAVVERLAEFAPTDEERSRLRRVADYLRAKGSGTLKTTAIAVGAQAARNFVGLP